MLGRDSRTLSKLFESMINRVDEYSQILVKAKEILVAPKKKFIKGLKY